MQLQWLFDFTTHLKIVLIITFMQHIIYDITATDQEIFHAYFQSDNADCTNCYDHQNATCQALFENLLPPTTLQEHLYNFMHYFTKRRQLQWLRLKHNEATNTTTLILAKRYTPNKSNKNSKFETKSAELELKYPRIGEFNYCTVHGAANRTTNRLIAYFQARGGYTKRAICLYMLENITPLLLPELAKLNFPVPKVHATCGFSIFQVNAGLTLHYYINASYRIRLLIAKQLLELVLQFSYGFHQFRIYITDLTLDNLAYDESKKQLTIIDIDTIFMVDALGAKQQIMHSYSIIPSADLYAFAYEPEEFCKASLYDVNIYQACHLLFTEFQLHLNNSELWQLLSTCVVCPVQVCEQRFELAQKLIGFIENMLSD